MQDNDLIFFESKTAPVTAKVLALNGSAYGRDHVFCTIPDGVTALTLTYSTSKDGVSFIDETHVASAIEIAKGLMGFPTSLHEVKYAKCVPSITGTAAKALVCGITDAIDNTEVFYSEGESGESESGS